jgi:hypothetical protein
LRARARDAVFHRFDQVVEVRRGIPGSNALVVELVQKRDRPIAGFAAVRLRYGEVEAFARDGVSAAPCRFE